jgi:hypothetical protein
LLLGLIIQLIIIFFESPFDGLLGTAKSTLSNQKVLTPIEALAKAGTLSGAFVGYALGRVSDSENIGKYTNMVTLKLNLRA